MVGHKLPPLNALRAFEAAARHLSVNFLTDAGKDYLPPVRNAFRQIAEASRRIMVSAEAGILTVSVTPFFAAAWLVPRLKGFQDAHPDIDLQIVTSNRLVDFSRDNADVAVRHGLGRYPGLRSHRIVAVEIIPVAAPTLIARLGMPMSPAELTRWPHVHDADRKGWHLWFQAQGVEEIGSPRGPAFDDSGLLIKAVLAGQGAGLLPAAMVAPDIAEGRLAKLADVVLLDDFAYYLVYSEASHEQPKVAAFRAWILDAAGGPRTDATAASALQT